jgi:hypothetical protein
MSQQSEPQLDALVELLTHYIRDVCSSSGYIAPTVWAPSMWGHERPSEQQVADDLLSHAEAQALRLGSWLETPEGAMIARAVELALPFPYRQDAQLLVDGLTLAARLQQGRRRREAARVAAVAVIVAVLFAVVAHGPQ